MFNNREITRRTILQRDNSDNYTWTVWIGAVKEDATKILNIDNSEPRLIQADITPEILALQSSITVDTEVYKLTWVTDDTPNADATYWISDDNGTTKQQVKFVNRRSRNQKAFWQIYFKK